MSNKSQFTGLNIMADRLRYGGGNPQQDRMIRDKRWSLDHAVKYSYQAAKVKKLGWKEVAPALINPNKTKQNYDDKIISIGTEYGYKPGDVFEWQNTGTKWLIYLQDLTELAYFRGDIRKCNYQVNWLDDDGEKRTIDMAVQGPTATRIIFIQKNGISVDEPNLDLNILMPKTEDTLKYFRRYAKFYLDHPDEGDLKTCYRVETTDSISMPGILQLTAVEYYANETTDDVEKGVVNGLVVKPQESNENLISLIKGEGFIKPKIPYTYTFAGRASGVWEYDDKKYPIKVVENGRSITITWTSSYSGQFEIGFAGEKKTIVVESLF